MVGRALGDEGAVFQHHKVFTDLHDQAHVVLDEQHGDATVTDGRDGIHQGHGLLVVHAARGLVQDQQPGVGGQGASDFQQALVAVGKTAGGLGVMVGRLQ